MMLHAHTRVPLRRMYRCPPQVLPQLLLSPDPHVLLFAALAVYHLAGMPHLRDPLGDAGAVSALVWGVRRYI